MNKRAALYVRVSTVEQKKEGQSLDSQIEALQTYCKENKLDIVNIYSDPGISAHVKYTRRPALLQMISDCQKGLVDVILITKLDRFFRSVKDYYAVMDQIGTVPWRAIWEDYETETSAGIFKVNIMLSVAQAESDRTSERVKAVRSYQRETGQLVAGKAPIGYIIRKQEIYKDPATKDAVDAFFKEYLLTYSTAKAIAAAAEYNVTISTLKAKRMLNRTAYMGNAYGFPCEPYITASDWEKIKESQLARHVDRDGKAKRVYLFATLTRCGICGHAASSYYTCKKAYNKEYHYKAYRCEGRKMSLCNNSSIRYESTIEKYLLNELDNIIGDYKIEAQDIVKKTKDSKKEIAKLNAKLDRLAELYSDGDITRSAYCQKRDEIKARIIALNAKAPDAPAVNLPDNWKEVYALLDDEHKRSFWRSIIDSITLIPGKDPIVKLRSSI